VLTLTNLVRNSFVLIWAVELTCSVRILRYLASRHVFTEVSPDVYANNRISSILTKTKPLEELKKEYVYYNHVTNPFECFDGVSDVTSLQ
jgi:hypothetical protein